MTDTAVIILNWNGAKMLRSYLPSVVANTNREIADIFVADNGSTDDSLTVLAEEFPGVKIIRFDENYGFAEGYNRAIHTVAGRYKYTVLLNSDVQTDTDWLTPLHSFMESHPKCGAASPKILAIAEPEKFEYAGACGGFLDRHGFPYCRGRIFDTVETDRGQYDSPMQVFWASGACFMVQNSIYEECGGLDPKFFAHMEEIDLCWRIQLAGYEVWAVPDSHVRHLGGGSLAPNDPRKTYLNFRNNLLMLHKNLPSAVRRGLLLRRRLLDTVAWAKFMASGQWSYANAILKAHRDFRKMRSEYKIHPKINLLNGETNIIFDYYARGRHTFNTLKN